MGTSRLTRLSREQHAIVFAGALSESLRLETYRAYHELAADRVIACETRVLEASAWYAERRHFRASPSYERRTLRRRALERAQRARLKRVAEAWAAAMLLEDLADAIEESARRLAREYVAAREVIEALVAHRIARGSPVHM